MPEYNKLIELLEEKKVLVSDFLEATLAVKMGTMDDMNALETHIKHRQELIDQIDAVDLLVDQMCADDGSRLKAIVLNKLDFGSLTKGEQRVFLAAQEIRRIIAIIMQEDVQAMDHMERMMSQLQENIKKNTMSARMSGYYQSIRQTADKGAFYNQKG